MSRAMQRMEPTWPASVLTGMKLALIQAERRPIGSSNSSRMLLPDAYTWAISLAWREAVGSGNAMDRG